MATIPQDAMREIYIAGFVGNVSYGAYLMLSCASIYSLLHRRRRMGRQNIVLAYTLVMLAVTTAWVAAGARWDAYYYVDMPYGTAPEDIPCTASQIILKVTAMLQVLLSDGLLIFRTYAIWGHTWQVVVLPVLLYIISIATGVAMNLQCAVPFLGGPINITLHEIFFVATIVCNVLATAAIVTRLVLHQRSLRTIGLADRPNFSEYATIAGVLTESAALYAVIGIIYLPIYILQLPVTPAISSVFGALSFISPAIIILRISLGISYDSARATTGAAPWHRSEDDMPTELSRSIPQPPEDMPPAWSSPLATWFTEKSHSRSPVDDDDDPIPSRSGSVIHPDDQA